MLYSKNSEGSQNGKAVRFKQKEMLALISESLPN